MSSVPTPVPSSVNSWSAAYLEDQYEAYQFDPESVSPEVRSFFRGFELAMAGDLRLHGVTPAANGRGNGTANGSTNGTAHALNGAAGGVTAIDDGPVRISRVANRPAGRSGYFQAVVDDFVDAYRAHGHLFAKLDALGRDADKERPDTLTLEHHGLDETALARTVDGSEMSLGDQATLRDVLNRLEDMYCGPIGAEFMHIQDTEQREWLIERFERAGGRIELNRGERAHVLEQLTKAEMFERFLGKRYPGEKRFSLEGAESLIPMTNHLLEVAAGLGVEEVVLGMAHRGRLNVLNNVLNKSYEQIFTEFEESWNEDFVDGGGDVKYHRGYSGTRRYPDGRMLHLAMASNPSHLEGVDPVVLGRCRAKQRLRADVERRRVIPVLIHGDAAVVGQGVVQEVLNMSQLEGYTTGGTIHIVVNNHIGFTTLPSDARSSRYCTDIGKAIEAPIFHVNGEDPEACVAVAQFAMEYRDRFRRDVFIDLNCYRRYGHNEQDETSFTQPIIAKIIKQKPSVLKVYAERLLAEGVIQEPDREAIRIRLDDALEKAQRAAQNKPNDPTIDPGSARWAGLGHAYDFNARGDTAVSMDLIKECCAAIGTVPEGFNLNPKLRQLLENRASLPETKEISYADAEHLAYATLLTEGKPVRLSGQDCRRGTFSHRHAVLFDTETTARYIPLNNIREMGVLGDEDHLPGSIGSNGKPRQARMCVYDSPLSEYGVLGFDYGYSLADPSMLVLWEAQFGDFVNGAQVMIDQFIASGETKWERWSGIVMLLPHGYEGAGPEHSSARMERFLKLAGNDNIQVCYPTTAAQTFHMLRRQVTRPFRKPLIVMSPKSMLRTPTSTIDELTTGEFREFLDDPRFAGDAKAKKSVKRVVLCCGKIYWELAERRDALGRDDVALLRVEQVYPFHREMLRDLLASYPDKAERCYVQEEPYNAAAYLFMNNKCENELGMERLRYIGRPSSGSPATGSKRMHKHEQEAIISEAVGPKPDDSKSA